MIKTCRYCDEQFEVRPGKRGFIDECESCLEERAPKPVAPPEKKAGPVQKKKFQYKSEAHARRAFNRTLRKMAELLAEMARERK